MFKKTESTRLGEILINKGLITPEQLAIATREQAKRKRLFKVDDTQPRVTLIGEILVELGFIDQLELKRGLNWQQRLRHVSIAMALCAPFMVFAPTSATAQTTSTTSSASSNFTPITIQSENYTTMSGIVNESTTDTGGGKNTANINTGDWMSYTNTPINIPTTGKYKITYRVASKNTAGSLALKEANTDATLDTVPVPITGGWQTWVDVTRTVTLTQGAHSFKLFAAIGDFNINWFKIEAVPAELPLLPLTIQAESYTSMSGVWNEPTTDTGGGQNTASINTGDWMSYTNTKVEIPTSGLYKITMRVAGKSAASIMLKEASTDAILDTIPIPVTGGWQNWVDVTRTVTLSQGTHSFKLFAAIGDFNINWFKIEPLPTQLPLTIQSESYSAMSGVANEPTTDVGGGQSTGYIDALDWMQYYNVEILIPATATYKMTYRLASPNSGTSFTLGEAGTSTIFDTITVPKTGGWQTWVSIERAVTLSAGKHTFAVKALVGGFNMNWFKLEPLATSTSTSSSTSSKSSSSSPSTVTSSSASSTPNTISNSTSSTSTTTSNSTSSTASANPSVKRVIGPAALSWAPPVQRENGNTLDITELGGYEIRYKQESAKEYTYVTINNPWTDKYNFSWLEGDYIFQIAAFDKNGVYSNFTDIAPI